MKGLVLLVAILALVSVPAALPVHVATDASELVAGRNWFFCALSATLLVGGIVTQQYYAAAIGATTFPTDCGLGW